MKHCIIVLLLQVLLSLAGWAQKTTETIQADSVLLTNCDSTELILENHTQNIPGFLYNTGRGRTIFRRPLVKLNDTLNLIGPDTLKLQYRWFQGGNAFGTTGAIGLRDNYPMDFYTNNHWAMRLNTNGNMLMGTTVDAGYMLQLVGHGAIFFDPNFSVASDQLQLGGLINTNDGQESLIRNSYYPVLEARGPSYGIGYAAPTGWNVGSPQIRTIPGYIYLVAPHMYFGEVPDTTNSSCLETAVSNTSEWGYSTAYPSGANYYYFGTKLFNPTAGKKRAPLKIAADQLHFTSGASPRTGTDLEVCMLSEAGNLVVGSVTDSSAGRLHVNGKVTIVDSLSIGASSLSAQLYTTGSVRLAGIPDTVASTRIITSDANGNIYYSDSSALATTDNVYSSLVVNGPVTTGKLILHPDEWADNVFDSAYQLLSLDVLEQYIRRDHHLPGIPSAESIASKGVDAGAMQVLLLKKVEEMTLYAIEGNKKSTAFLQSVDNQEAKLDNIDKRLTDIENKLKK